MREIPSVKNLALPMIIVVSIFAAQWMRSKEKLPVWQYEGQIMGTTFTVKLIHSTEIKLDTITEALESVNERMSTYSSHSELSVLNTQSTTDPIRISTQLNHVLQAAKEVSRASNGSFDVTVGPIVNAWGFGPNKENRSPTNEVLNTLRERTGDHLWSLQDMQVTKINPNIYLDLSAIAKGYAVDQVAQVLDSQNIHRYFIDVGGEIRVKGVNGEAQLWKVGIERPAGKGLRRIFKVIKLDNQSIATSGDYRNRYVDQNGIIRSHTINPKTAEPIKHTLASVSVLHSSCMYADAWATALNVLGPKDGLILANKLGLAAYFIQRTALDPNQTELDGSKTQYEALLSESMMTYLKDK